LSKGEGMQDGMQMKLTDFGMLIFYDGKWWSQTSLKDFY